MLKNPLKEIMRFMKSNKPSTQEKQNDFFRAKEVLLSSKTLQQLISAVKFINNFNKKHGITETSPEFIYFDRMIMVMKLKIKSKKVGDGEEIDESNRMNRTLRNIIKLKLRESLGWSDKDDSFNEKDTSFENSPDWGGDDEWGVNPEKSYWKQGDVGDSDNGGGMNESDLDWMRDNSISGKELRELILKTKAPTIPFDTVWGDLNLNETAIKDLGNLQSVEGNLNLNETAIKDLGDLQSVGGSLYLNGTAIKNLGNLQSVGGGLYLYETPIKDLGNLQSVGGNLYLRGTPLAKKHSEEEIRQMVEVNGNIYL